MGTAKRLFNISIESEMQNEPQQEQVLDLGMVADENKIEVEIDNDIVTLENSIDAQEILEEQVETNEKALEETNGDVAAELVEASNETLAYSLGLLKVNKEMKSQLMVSYEGKLSNREKLKISTESVKEVISKIIKKIMEFFKYIWNKIKEWFSKLGAWLGFSNKKASDTKKKAENINKAADNLKKAAKDKQPTGEVPEVPEELGEMFEELNKFMEDIISKDPNELPADVIDAVNSLCTDIINGSNEIANDRLEGFEKRNTIIAITFLTGSERQIPVNELKAIYSDAVTDNVTLAADTLVKYLAQGTNQELKTLLNFSNFNSKCFKRLNAILEMIIGEGKIFFISNFDFETLEISYMEYDPDLNMLIHKTADATEHIINNKKILGKIDNNYDKEIVKVCDFLIAKSVETKKLETLQKDYQAIFDKFTKAVKENENNQEVVHIAQKVQMELYKMLLDRPKAFKNVRDAINEYASFVTAVITAQKLDQALEDSPFKK